MLTRKACAMAAVITAGVLLTGAAPNAGASAATRIPDLAPQPAGAGLTVSGDLESVAAISAGNAWAVGTDAAGQGHALILHWNGHAWSQVATGLPPGAASSLRAVAASSAVNAWAVGTVGTKPLILHWNGHGWKQAAFSAPAGTVFSSVSVTSGASAWAVGLQGAAPFKPVALHWNGGAWKPVVLPKLPLTKNVGAALGSVSATSAGSAWAAGDFIDMFAGAGPGFTLHWNGKSWRRVPSAPASHGSPAGIAAAAAGHAWLIGCPCQGGPDGAVIGFWTGRTWKTVTHPIARPGTFGGTGNAITASGHLAWAAGDYCAARCRSSRSDYQAFLLRWTGSAWKQTPAPPDHATILGLAVTSATNAWAVGTTPTTSGTSKTLILHWNGSKWSPSG
jgi:hypothetical protein